jgi:hypothetical protein
LLNSVDLTQNGWSVTVFFFNAGGRTFFLLDPHGPALEWKRAIQAAIDEHAAMSSASTTGAEV